MTGALQVLLGDDTHGGSGRRLGAGEGRPAGGVRTTGGGVEDVQGVVEWDLVAAALAQTWGLHVEDPLGHAVTLESRVAEHLDQDAAGPDDRTGCQTEGPEGGL